MKKYLLIISAFLILGGVGCVGKPTAPKTTVFSDSKANFTFEYPANWVLNSSMPESEFIENKIYVFSDSYEYPDPCPVLDGNGQEVLPIIKTYVLTDKNYSAAVQMCGQVAAISWESAPPSTSVSGLTTIHINAIEVRLNELKDDFSTTTQEFIDQIERIVKSIRIK